MSKLYPSKDGKLFPTKELRDAHNNNFKSVDSKSSQPFSALIDFNQSILDGSA